MKKILFLLTTGLSIASAQAPPVVPSDLQPIVTAVNTVDGTVEETPVGLVSTPVAPDSKPTGPKLICRGTNPPWILKIENLRMDFQHSDYSPVFYSAPVATPSLNSSPSITNYSGTSQDGTLMNALVVDARINGGTSCNDKMSNQEYEFSVYINRGGQILDGCCWMER